MNEDNNSEPIDQEKILFPYPQIRPIQDEFIQSAMECLEDKKALIVHAPTGLGKTAASLSPCLSYALANKLKVLFLTSRHTQHHLAIETLKDIKAKYDTEFIVTDLIGKQWMCSQPGATSLYSSEFSEFCKKLREEKTCEFFNNVKDGLKITVKAKETLEVLKQKICHTEEINSISRDAKLCPYEMSILLASKANVIIADYYYVFHPKISENFLKKANIDLDKCIIIVDEAHNLPIRIMDLASTRLTSNVLQRAIKEAKKFNFTETIAHLVLIQDILNSFSEKLKLEEETLVDKERFINEIEKEISFHQLQSDLEFISDTVHETQRQSYIGSVAEFLESWLGPKSGYARMVKFTESMGKPNVVLSNNCLDPSIVSKPVLELVHSTIFMSGTLTPTIMYRDLLGFDDPMFRVFPSPFPNKNRLNIINPKTTTKYTSRSADQFNNISEECVRVTNQVPGNSLLFFPSYFMRDQVYKSFSVKSKKTCFLERPNLTKEEKTDLLERFKQYKKSGAVLLAVSGGSFSEGVDLPGDLLKCVIIIGLPLKQPDLETKELIKYYDKKFGKGWDYGYIFPAFNKAIQSAGRCIRSETDRGVIVFLDERYIWPRYKQLFPQDWDILISRDSEQEIKNFFLEK